MIIGYKCKHCGQFTIWGCRNEYDEHFCNEKCYLEYCEKHGYLKGKIRIRKTQDDKVFVVKTMRFITEEEMETLREKRAKLKKGG